VLVFDIFFCGPEALLIHKNVSIVMGRPMH